MQELEDLINVLASAIGSLTNPPKIEASFKSTIQSAFSMPTEEKRIQEKAPLINIKDSFKKNDEIIIYDYFLKVINNECYTSYVKDSKNDKCTKALENNKNVDYKFLKKYGTKYKHVFKKDNNVYHWVSSEKIN